MAAFPASGEIEAYLRKRIPLSAAMGVRVIAAESDRVTLSAPLAPNINHRATVFGGSASAIAILAAWTWLHFTLRAAGQPSRLVIQKNTVDYLAPIAGEFEAHCVAPPAAPIEKFLRTPARHGRARIAVAAVLTCDAEKVAAFSGDYVAIKLSAGESAAAR
jgi:thioesterase domain-containing protein